MPDEPVKKHPCPDCTYCQWCADDRCRLCMGHAGCRRRKRSITEQIEAFEARNSSDSDDSK